MQASILVAVIHTAPPCRLKRRLKLRLSHFCSPPFTSSVHPSTFVLSIDETNPSPYPSSSSCPFPSLPFLLSFCPSLHLRARSFSFSLSFSSFSLFFFLVVQLLCFTRRLTSSTSMERSRSNDTKQKEETYSVRCMKPFIDFLTNCRLSRGELYILNSDHWM